MKRSETEGVPRSGNSFNPVSWSQDLAARQLVAASKSRRTHFALWYHNPNNHYYCRHLLNPKPVLPAPATGRKWDLLFGFRMRTTRISYRKLSFAFLNLFNYSNTLEWERPKSSLRFGNCWTNIYSRNCLIIISRHWPTVVIIIY